MDSEKSKISVPPTPVLNLPDKIDLRRKGKYIASSNLGIHYTLKTIKMSCKNNKFKMPAPIWNEEFELPDGSYSISDIEDCFEHTLKRYREKAVHPSIRIYTDKIENRITFKIKIRVFLELLTPERMKSLGSTKSKITKVENSKNVTSL